MDHETFAAKAREGWERGRPDFLPAMVNGGSKDRLWHVAVDTWADTTSVLDRPAGVVLPGEPPTVVTFVYELVFTASGPPQWRVWATHPSDKAFPAFIVDRGTFAFDAPLRTAHVVEVIRRDFGPAEAGRVEVHVFSTAELAEKFTDLAPLPTVRYEYLVDHPERLSARQQ